MPQADYIRSGERYNIVFPILEIIRHPEFSPTKGNDIAVFKVSKEYFQNNAEAQFELRPACLPYASKKIPKTGLQTGWSKPPPFPFIESQAPLFSDVYNNFYKQWHYKLDIFETCEDPTTSLNCDDLQFPSNTSYPPGTVCARDFTRESCFSPGDSGSPLMVQYQGGQDRMHVVGLLSGTKGCHVATSPFKDSIINNPVHAGVQDLLTSPPPNTIDPNILDQRVQNPTIYTKLSCYLPWVAEQYNMKYQNSDEEDKACQKGSGDKNVGNNNLCRATEVAPKSITSLGVQTLETIELECKFPFYYNGVKYHECILFTELDFTFPVFRCPTG